MKKLATIVITLAVLGCGPATATKEVGAAQPAPVETPAPSPPCTCPDGYVLDGEACNPQCYTSTPPCMMPSLQCTPSATP